MCQFSSEDGVATDWHFVHLGSRAVGVASLRFVQAHDNFVRGSLKLICV
jgi:hypothetical protein